MKKDVLLAVTLIAGACFGTMRPDDFRCRRPLTAPDSSSGNLATCRLDSLIYRNTDDGFHNMRIFDDSGNEVAFVVRTVTANDTDTVRYPIRLERGEFRRVKGGGASVVFSRGEDDSVPTRVSIVTGTTNFEKNITILGSSNRKSWKKLAENRPIFDYTRFIDIRNTTVEFAHADCRFYKIVIDSVWSFKRSAFSRIVRETDRTRYTEFMQHQEPFRLDGIDFGSDAVRVRYGEPVSRTVGLDIDSVFQDTVEKTTGVFLASNREPVSRLLLSVADSNFIRKVHVYATNDSVNKNAVWKQIGSGEIQSICSGNYKSSSLEIPVSSVSRYLFYRLMIANRDNMPITVTAVRSEGPRHEVLFFHHGAKQLMLCYGTEEAEIPRYDVQSVLSRSPVTSGILWKLGSEEMVTVKKITPFINPRYILFGVFGVMVAVLVVILGVAVRKVDEKTGTES